MQKDVLYKRYILLAVTMSAFLTPFMGSSVNLAVPSIAAEFNASTVLISWVVSSYILSSAAFLVPFGRLADIIGRKKIFILGIAFFAISSLLCALAWSIESLIAMRLVQGIGSAMIFSTGMAILTSVFPPQERGKVLGINVATVYVGLSLGPVLGGAINHNLGWEYIFYLCAVIAVFVLLITLSKLKEEWAGAKGEKYDLTGAVLYSIGLVLFMYGISTVTTSSAGKYLAVLGLAVLLVFVRYEMSLAHPILNITIFRRNAAFAFSNLAALINYSATFAVAFLLSLYLQVAKGYNSQTAGFILLAQPVIMVVISPFAGRLSDRIEPRLVASVGMVLTTAGLLSLCFLSQNTPLWLIMANLALLGTGFALFSSPNSNAVMSSVEKKFYGVASSTLGTMRLTGQAISLAIVTLMLTHFLGDVELSAAYAKQLITGTKVSFVVFTLICFGGIFASMARGDIREKQL